MPLFKPCSNEQSAHTHAYKHTHYNTHVYAVKRTKLKQNLTLAQLESNWLAWNPVYHTVGCERSNSVRQQQKESGRVTEHARANSTTWEQACRLADALSWLW